MISSTIESILLHATAGNGQIVVMTGAGISAESGIPTFRGIEGFWTVGSRDYHPQELATWDTFSNNQELVWPWYLYRRAMCRASLPNDGHYALATLESALGERFKLVTQNVDGLHLRAGSTLERCYEVHGNIDFMRCSKECGEGGGPQALSFLCPVPDIAGSLEKNAAFSEEWKEPLSCDRCGAWMRPHVLWFDECYDEQKYRYESAINTTINADLLLTIGSSGATNLPMMMANIAMDRNIPIIDINVEANPFSEFAATFNGDIRATASEALPLLVETMIAALDEPDD